jgi:DUF1365 family protein
MCRVKNCTHFDILSIYYTYSHEGEMVNVIALVQPNIDLPVKYNMN